MRCKVWKRSLLFLLSVMTLCAVFSACGHTNTKKQNIQFFSMDTIMEITAYGECGKALSLARERIETLDIMLDVTDPNSLVSSLQNGDAVDSDIAIPLQTVQQIAQKTNGALDLTLYPLSAKWGFYSGEYCVPSPKIIQDLLDNLGTWSIEKNRFYCTDGLKPDLGCVAKGYAAQCAAETLRNNGVSSAVLMLGGNVQTLGQKPDGSDWIISVADPRQTDGTVGDLHVGECAVVTSGSYQRNFTQNGRLYHHILDPSTGYPAESGLVSVTVVCKNGTMADALSTALFIIGIDASKALYDQHVFSFDAIFITEEHEIFLTEGLADRFEQTNETYTPFTILR